MRPNMRYYCGGKRSGDRLVYGIHAFDDVYDPHYQFKGEVRSLDDNPYAAEMEAVSRALHHANETGRKGIELHCQSEHVANIVNGTAERLYTNSEQVLAHQVGSFGRSNISEVAIDPHGVEGWCKDLVDTQLSGVQSNVHSVNTAEPYCTPRERTDAAMRAINVTQGQVQNTAQMSTLSNSYAAGY